MTTPVSPSRCSTATTANLRIALLLTLVKQIVAMNEGRYLEEELLDAEPLDFCIGVGGYPEKHFEAPNLEVDVRYTKEKVDAGADYIVTQMFYDNEVYFRYVDACRAAGIEVPIIPGLKVLTQKRHLRSLPSNFYVNLPAALVDEVSNAKSSSEVLEIGVEWALDQARELLEKDVPSLHFYVMQSSKLPSAKPSDANSSTYDGRFCFPHFSERSDDDGPQARSIRFRA